MRQLDIVLAFAGLPLPIPVLLHLRIDETNDSVPIPHTTTSTYILHRPFRLST